MRQPVHKDCTFAHPQYPYYFIANIPLCDFTTETGATEFWLGSHAHASFREQVIATTPEQIVEYGRLGEPLPAITEEAKEARRAIRPPIQPECAPGDIMIRDLRLWHAGMPNESDKHRIMLGLGYQVRTSTLCLMSSQDTLNESLNHVKHTESALSQLQHEVPPTSAAAGFLHAVSR